MRFGQGPLRDPLLVDLIETYFVPLCVYNNVKAEAALLKRYQEPSWNNPVFRFYGANRKELIPRKDRVWDASGLASRSVLALEAAKVKLAPWASLIAMERAPKRLEHATFVMY